MFSDLFNREAHVECMSDINQHRPYQVTTKVLRCNGARFIQKLIVYQAVITKDLRQLVWYVTTSKGKESSKAKGQDPCGFIGNQPN